MSFTFQTVQVILIPFCNRWSPTVVYLLCILQPIGDAFPDTLTPGRHTGHWGHCLSPHLGAASEKRAKEQLGVWSSRYPMRGGAHNRISLLLHPWGHLVCPLPLWMQVLQVIVPHVIWGHNLQGTARNGANKVECRMRVAGDHGEEPQTHCACEEGIGKMGQIGTQKQLHSHRSDLENLPGWIPTCACEVLFLTPHF